MLTYVAIATYGAYEDWDYTVVYAGDSRAEALYQLNKFDSPDDYNVWKRIDVWQDGKEIKSDSEVWKDGEKQ
jgi:hypothetical protein